MKDLSTWIRAIIAVAVVVLTYRMTELRTVAPQERIPQKPAVESTDASGKPIPAAPTQPIPKEWEAIFILVIGYYFADRQKTETLQRALLADNATNSMHGEANLEVRLQFVFALVLIGATIGLFLSNFGTQNAPEVRAVVDGAWVAGVALGVGFYFRNTDVSTIDQELGWYRAILALLMIGATVLMFVRRPNNHLPLQWLTLVLIVVTFYFKERK